MLLVDLNNVMFTSSAWYASFDGRCDRLNAYVLSIVPFIAVIVLRVGVFGSWTGYENRMECNGIIAL